MEIQKKNDIQIAEKNNGTKIAVRQDGIKVIFGDDDLSIRCDTRQRDIPVTVDICADDNGNLVIGVGTGRYYVAQVDIPAIQCTEVENETEEGGTHEERVPLDMGDVVVTLWSIDDLPIIQ